MQTITFHLIWLPNYFPAFSEIQEATVQQSFKLLIRSCISNPVNIQSSPTWQACPVGCLFPEQSKEVYPSRRAHFSKVNFDANEDTPTCNTNCNLKPY